MQVILAWVSYGAKKKDNFDEVPCKKKSFSSLKVSIFFMCLNDELFLLQKH